MIDCQTGFISFSGDFAASVVTCCNQLAMRCDFNVFDQTLDSLLSLASTASRCTMVYTTQNEKILAIFCSLVK